MARKKGKKNRETIMPRNQMSLEGSPDISPPSLSDVLIKLIEIIQVKVNTDERIQNLEKTVQDVHNRREKDLSLMLKKVFIDEIKEDLKRELIDEVKDDLKRKLEDEVKEKFKRELIDEVKEDVKRELKAEVKEDLKRQLIDEVNKYLLGEFNKMRTEYMENHPRNQSTQTQKARFRLQINSEVISPAYKGKPIQTRESDGCIVVELYEGDSLIGPDHPLASVTVQLVILHDPEFQGIEGHWSKEYFEKLIVKNVKYGKFALHNGSCRHEGAVITENSNRKEVKLGVMIVDLEGTIKERVLEGVSKPFKVQEAKTEPINNRGKRKEATDDVSPTMMHNPAKKINAQVAGKQNSLPPTQPNMRSPSKIGYTQGAGSTVDLLSNLQDQQNSLPPTQQMVNNAPSMWKENQGHRRDGQFSAVNQLQQANTAQYVPSPLDYRVPGKQNSLPPTQQMANNAPSMRNLQQGGHMTQEAGTNLGGQPQAYYHHTAQQETPQQKIQVMLAAEEESAWEFPIPFSSSDQPVLEVTLAAEEESAWEFSIPFSSSDQPVLEDWIIEEEQQEFFDDVQ